MSASFSGAFSSAFASGGGTVFSQPSFEILTRIVDSTMYQDLGHAISWAATVMIGSVDVSARLCGQISISGAEESARLAEFSVIPVSAAELAGYDSALVTVDLTIFSGLKAATFRRFTGVVESWDLSVSSRVVTVSCRDGYQERIKACPSAAAVEKLFSGLETVCPSLVKWSDSTPSPTSYFSSLLATVPGSCIIDGAGLWRASRWDIGSPAEIFQAADIFDDTISISSADRSGLPSAIDASLTVRINRLHALEVDLSWDGMPYNEVGLGLGAWVSKSAVMAALNGLSGWYIKGSPVLTTPSRTGYVINLPSGGTAGMVISDPESTCIAARATMYHRWYQQVDYKYTLSIVMGGTSDRDASISEALESSWDASTWESATSSTNSTEIYAANPPVSVPSMKTGYEGLPAPFPPANGAVDHYPDLSSDDIQKAARFVVAKAIRLAAAGRRKRTVEFSKPIDPRWEIFDVLGLAASGVASNGQLKSFKDLLNFDNGSATTDIVLACPQGNGTTTGIVSSSVSPPIASGVNHSVAAPILGNWMGASTTMEIVTDDSRLLGLLSNVNAGNNTYDAGKPAYTPQFRIVMPGVSADLRDPATINLGITTDYKLASGELNISF